MRGRAKWMDDPGRVGWVTNSLKSRIAEMRGAEERCRVAFRKPYMSELADYLADAYADAVVVLEGRLRTINAPPSPEKHDDKG